ncbi:MAG TPA: trehalase family glycosidase [Terriglobales bacterium]|nr:trehalase family glycosidase [Terriglobales bacterium]
MRSLVRLLAMLLVSVQVNSARDLKPTLDHISAAYAKLAPQTIRPSEGYLKYPYLIPAGFYKQMWDWDGFFIGSHFAHQSREQAQYLKFWVLNFANVEAQLNMDGWVPGVLLADRLPTPKPNPVLGWFMVKPFLAQGAVIASEKLGDYQWVSPIWENLRQIQSYRERTQYDPKWGLFFWETAVQSGEDNNVALTNNSNDRNAILAVDLGTFQLREYKAMARLAEMLGKKSEAGEYRDKADKLRAAIIKRLWFPGDTMFFNVRRDTGKPVRRISGSNFISLVEDILPPSQARAMIRRYLWNSDYMLALHGIRSLSKQDPSYNNVSMISPYSNWQGPVWINTNFLYYLALKRYGFNAEAAQLAGILARMVLADIAKWGSMHECYDAETGEGLAPTAEQVKEHVFPGFVGWNLLVEDLLQCEVKTDCLKLDWPDIK